MLLKRTDVSRSYQHSQTARSHRRRAYQHSLTKHTFLSAPRSSAAHALRIAEVFLDSERVTARGLRYVLQLFSRNLRISAARCVQCESAASSCVSFVNLSPIVVRTNVLPGSAMCVPELAESRSTKLPGSHKSAE